MTCISEYNAARDSGDRPEPGKVTNEDDGVALGERKEENDDAGVDLKGDDDNSDDDDGDDDDDDDDDSDRGDSEDKDDDVRKDV